MLPSPQHQNCLVCFSLTSVGCTDDDCCFIISLTSSDEIMQQEIRPLLAMDIIEQLHRQFAFLSGR